MADKLKLNQVTGGDNLATLNGNFDKIAEVVNENLLSRAVEQYDQPNQMETDLDMNGNHIYNLPFPTTRMEPLTREAIDTTLAILDKNMDHYHEANQIMEYTINSAATTLQNKLDAEDAARRAEEAAGIAGGGGTGLVRSFNGREGAVLPLAGDYDKLKVGLANVDNTSDAQKPISVAQRTVNGNLQAQIDAIIAGGGGGVPFDGVVSFNNRKGVVQARAGDYDKLMIGLPNVDNTSDDNKPISTAQAAKNAEIIAMIQSQPGTTASGLGKNNLLINGDFHVDQRKGQNITNSQTGWAGDRWAVSHKSPGAVLGVGSFFSTHSESYGQARIITKGPAITQGTASFSQYLDTLDSMSLRGYASLFSFDLMMTGAPSTFVFSTSFNYNARRICFKHTYTGNGGWQRFSVYLPQMELSDATPSNPNAPFFAAAVVFGAGSDSIGSYYEDSALPGAWPASGHSFSFAGHSSFMSLDPGATINIRRATLEVLDAPLTVKPAVIPHCPTRRAATYAECQRFYQLHEKFNFTGTGNTADTVLDHNMSLGIPMRKAPEVTLGPSVGNINSKELKKIEAYDRVIWFQSSSVAAGRTIYICNVMLDAEFGL